MPLQATPLELYEAIFLIRSVEEAVRRLYPSDVMKTPVHLSIGQEAIVAGVCLALKRTDHVFGTYRNHALYLAKGGDIDKFFAELFGRIDGAAKGKAGSMHISAPEAGFMASSAIVSSIIPVALGDAYSSLYQGRQAITAVFFGDGATEEGVFWESLNFASLKNLPLLFVCENNELAIHAHLRDRQSYSIPDVCRGFNLNVFSQNLRDPMEIHLMAREAVGFIRASQRPALIHLRYHRHLEHVGIAEDFNCGYRCKEDYADWYASDPVVLQRESLLALGMDDERILEIEAAIAAKVESSLRKGLESSYPGACELLEDVMA